MDWKKYNPPEEVRQILLANPHVTLISTVQELVDLSVGGPSGDSIDVTYDVPGYGRVVEASVARVRNGISANFTTPYMRRRDPDALVVGDERPTDKQTFQQRFGYEFSILRARSFEWLTKTPLVMYAFISGKEGMGVDSLVLAPANAGFFAFGLALLQGIISYDEIPKHFNPKAVLYVCPPFRYTDLGGK